MPKSKVSKTKVTKLIKSGRVHAQYMLMKDGKLIDFTNQGSLKFIKEHKKMYPGSEPVKVMITICS